jgi:hypothetical protein
MRTPVGRIRKALYLMIALMISAALAACGSGGSSTGASGTPGGGIAGPVSMNVTLGGADVAPPVSEIPPGLLAPPGQVPAGAAVPASAPSRATFTHVNVYMTGVAFIPVDSMPSSDLRPPLEDGEALFDGPEDDFSPKFVVFTFPEPVVFDLLNPPTAREIAKFLNKIEVPAGVYHKIRVYYEKVEVDGQIAHRTANGHLDIHFKAAASWDADDVHVDNRGYLVIPVAPNPADGVRLYCVAIRIFGLKVHETGSGKIIVRPQVFAELARPVKYSITGTAENVVHDTRSFDIRTLANLFPTVYHPLTRWAFDENVFDPTAWEVPVDNTIGIAALRPGAFVEAIGAFRTNTTPLTFRADQVFITFPDVKEGVVDNGWRADDTFVLRLAADNVVYPKPGRGTAYYDNLANLAQQLDNTFIDNNVPVKARGYAVAATPTPPAGIEAYWISIGP